MKDWLLTVFGFVLVFLLFASIVGRYIELYERIKGIVIFFINIPRDTRAFIVEAKKHLVPDNKLPTSKTNRDD